MKKIILFFLCSIMMFGCGVSNKDKQLMQSALNNELRKSYDNKDIITMVNAELTEIKKEDNMYGGAYSGRFKCTLSPLDNDDKISLWGEVAFDKNKRIQSMPKRYGDNKVAIYISLININNTPVPPKELDSCKFILDRFMNKNKISDK